MNVSMQRLAESLSLSPGNLTYHFPKKADLMLAIYDRFQEEMLAIIPTPDKNRPSLVGLNHQMDQFFQLQQRFLFFYLDLLEIERAYQEIAQRHFRHIERQINAIHQSLAYNSNMEYLRKREESNYRYLAEQIWFTAVFWPKQCLVRGIENQPEEMKKTIWHQIKPFLTEKGMEEFKNLNRQLAEHENI